MNDKNNARPGKNNISVYTDLENLKTSLKLKIKDKTRLQNSLSNTKINESSSIIKPSQLDYMILQLDRVSQNIACGFTVIELTDKKLLTVKLLSKETQVVQVRTFDCICPLNVLISDKKGDLEVYTSKEFKIPTKSLNDQITTLNFFKIKDASFKFITKYVYMTFYALTNASFSITVWFGNSSLKPQKSLKKTIKPENSLEKSLIFNESILKYRSKDFIKLNKTFIYKSSSQNNLNQKITQIKNKKLEIFNNVQSEKFINANKSAIKIRLEKTFNEMKGIMQRKTFFEKNWISFIYSCVFIDQIRMRYDLRRHIRENIKKVTNSVVKIQRSVLYIFYRNTKAKINIRRAKNILKLYHYLLNGLFKKKSLESIKNAFVARKGIDLLSSKIEKVVKSAVLIQKHFFEYLITEDIRLNEVISIFRAALAEKASLVQKLKNKKKVEENLNKLKKISDKEIEFISKYHIKRAKLKYIKEVNKYYKEKNKIKKLKIINRKKFRRFTPFPQYLYLVSVATAKKIIESYIESTEAKENA
jgi:hypothetical protein